MGDEGHLIQTTTFVDEHGEPVVFEDLPVIGDQQDDDNEEVDAR